jgi:peptidoglycan hydrolase-like protein with peptidoglycan-binding domain
MATPGVSEGSCSCGGECSECQDASSTSGTLTALPAATGAVLRLTDDEKLLNLTSPQLAGDDRLQQAFDDSPPLQAGEKSGESVRLYQQGLVDDGFAMSKSEKATGPDGVWGPETTRVTRDFQAKHGLSVDGRAGRETLGALDEMYKGRAGSPPKTAPEDLSTVRKQRSNPTGSRIFFEKDSAVVAADEQATVAALAAPPDRELTLTGLRSEDEAATLASDRANSTLAAFTAAKHTGAKTADPQPDSSKGQINYRQVRAVEVTPTGSKKAVPDCSAGPDVDCGPDPSPFSTGHDRALDMLTQAIGALAAPDQATLDLVKQVFGSASVASTVRKNLVKLHAHVAEMSDAKHHRCHNECDGTCADATAYNTGLDAGAMMTLCPGYQALGDVDERGALLIHEGSHGTSGLIGAAQGTDDKAYEFERIINFLSKADALDNADSYAIFVRNLINPGSAPMGPQTPDTFTGLTSEEGQAVERAIAFAEKWFDGDENAATEAYGEAQKAKSNGSWAASFGQNAASAIGRRLPVTSPPTVPTDDDIHRFAGVNDRFHGLFRVLGRPVSVSKTAVGEEVFTSNPLTFVVTDAFFRLSKREQLDLVIAKMVQADPDIPADQEGGFVTLADDLRTLDGVSAP